MTTIKWSFPVWDQKRTERRIIRELQFSINIGEGALNLLRMKKAPMFGV